MSGQDSFENWAAVNVCTEGPVVITYGDISCRIYSDCGNGGGVIFCFLNGGNHNDLNSHRDISLTDMAWDFMSKYLLQK